MSPDQVFVALFGTLAVLTGGVFTRALLGALWQSLRPQPGDKPVQIETPFDGIVTRADVVAQLTASGSTVANEFLDPAERVDHRTLAAGVLAVPDDADLPPGLPAGAVVVRTRHPDRVRWRPGPHGTVDVHAAVPVQTDVPSAPPRGGDPLRRELHRLAGEVRATARANLPRTGILAAGQPKPLTTWPPDDTAARLTELAESRRRLAAAIPQLADGVRGLPGRHARHARHAYHQWSRGGDPANSIRAARAVAARDEGGELAPYVAVSLVDAIDADLEAASLQRQLTAHRAAARPSAGRAGWH